MRPQRLIESLVGFFLILAFVSLAVLAFKVSGLTSLLPAKTYSVTADFDDIGGLKVRSAVKIGGVQIGEVAAINLDEVTFRAVVTMRIFDQYNQIPDDSSAGIYTAGLLGDNYVAISPQYSKTFLKNGSQIAITRSAMVLEKLIGQFIYKISNSNSTNNNGNGDNNAHS